LFKRRLDRKVNESRPAAAHDRPLQLMLDDVLHPLELRREQCRRRFAAIEEPAHRGQRRLEAVREVAERGAVALQPLVLADKQRIEVARDAGQFTRPAAAARLAPPRLDIHDLGLEPSQRTERDPQRNRESAEQQESQQQEPGDDAGAHAQQLLVPGLEALSRADDEICSRSIPGFPANAERKPKHAGSVRTVHPFLGAPYRQLPAHLGFRCDRMPPSTQGKGMQRAAEATGESLAIGEDAGAVDDSRPSTVRVVTDAVVLERVRPRFGRRVDAKAAAAATGSAASVNKRDCSGRSRASRVSREIR
jgi:hypothetical protein